MSSVAVSLRKPTTDPTPEDFRSGLSTLLEKLPANTVQGHAFFSVPANEPPWFDTGLDLRAGEHVTVLAVGHAVLPSEHDLRFYPDMQLWYRVGESGHIFRGTRQSHSFMASQPGRLYFGSYFPGEWTTRTGAMAVGTEAYRMMQGGLEILVLRWADHPLDGLKRMVALGDVSSLLASEIDRLQHAVKPPEGWEYLWFLGQSEIYGTGPDSPAQRPSITCYTQRDAAILHKNVSVPLSPDTRLCWSWKMETFPCQLPENTLENHDYLSIAVEFDNGQDLAFFWSSQLPVDTGFRCPIPTWTARETHVVARSGSESLGRWMDEERPLHTYYERFVGTIGKRDETHDPRVVAPPTRIERIWLIANSMFRRQQGRCDYGAIELQTGGKIIRVN
ncbi:MAG TPA: DUF3047 domain-containing protein [Steroidobacter sp.]|uniref:DUF3047 domain-containing protein n=1 Tax=Steroidobacter sp. TaxID=1978227 RepID=UPI002EDA467F